MEDLPVMSLFSGAGGLDLGFEEAGFEPQLAIDKDPAAVATYNWNRRRRHGPARVADLLDVGEGDIAAWWGERASGDVQPVGVIGGPPCQAFSIGNSNRTPEDPRALLPLAYADLLKALNARYQLGFFAFENVAGLGRPQHEDYLANLIERFEDAGFNVHKPFYLDAAAFGVPQRRKRLFVVGFNKTLAVDADFAQPIGMQPTATVGHTIRGLANPVPFSRKQRPADLGLHPNHWYMNPRSKKLLNGSRPTTPNGRSFRRLKWGAPSWTVAYGHREVHVHPNGRRRLSVYEAMLLQGFPNWYELRGTLSDQFRLVSDAVPPPVGNQLALAIRSCITSKRPSSPTGS
jgi:DNA (cytosine-5)-methyltransferase 1